MTDITAITTRFGKAYARNKKAKTWLESQQKKLFSAFDVELERRLTSQRNEQIPDGEDPEAYVKSHFPGWEIVTRSGDWVILKEDPSYLSHTHINRVDGMVYGRDQVVGTPSLDDERLRQEDSALWERITEMPEPWWSLVRDVFARSHTYWSEATVDTMTVLHLEEHGIQRVIKDLNTFNTRDLALVEKYILPGRVSVRLRPPREAKPEELE